MKMEDTNMIIITKPLAENERILMNKIVGLFFCISLMIISQDSRADLIAPDVLIKNTTEEVLSIVKQDKQIVARQEEESWRSWMPKCCRILILSV